MSEPPARRARWVDFHCHLDLYSDHAELIAECDRERVATLVGTDAHAHDQHPANGALFLGIHYLLERTLP